MAAPTMAEAVYADGPKRALGNADPDRILGEGDYDAHARKLRLGTASEREAFVQKYGVGEAEKILHTALMDEIPEKQGGTVKGEGHHNWWLDAREFYRDLLRRKGGFQAGQMQGKGFLTMDPGVGE